MFFLVMLTAYLITSTIATRKIYAREVATAEAKPMKHHDRGCNALIFSTKEYQRSHCKCGFFNANDRIPHVATLFVGWPLMLFVDFLKGGTYNPKGVDYQRIKELENELDMMRDA